MKKSVLFKGLVRLRLSSQMKKSHGDRGLGPHCSSEKLLAHMHCLRLI